MGVPVLFIPGHAGSYKQVRSIAAEAAYLFYGQNGRQTEYWDRGQENLDVFTGTESPLFDSEVFIFGPKFLTAIVKLMSQRHS